MFILVTAGQYEKHYHMLCKWKSSHSFTEVISRGKRHGMQLSGRAVTYKSCVAGSIPAIPIPVNCHYRKAFPKGKAEAIKIKAEAEAEANRKIAESLTPELIEKQKIDKWNGEVPKIQGSNTSTIVDTRDMTADENAE